MYIHTYFIRMYAGASTSAYYAAKISSLGKTESACCHERNTPSVGLHSLCTPATVVVRWLLVVYNHVVCGFYSASVVTQFTPVPNKFTHCTIKLYQRAEMSRCSQSPLMHTGVHARCYYMCKSQLHTK